MLGPDHKASLNPKDFKLYVDNIIQGKKLLGSYQKILNKSEILTKKIVSRYIVAKQFIKKGEIFTRDNITCKRTFNGISPNNWFKILGKKSQKNFNIDERISLR
jgi:N-acetylneuraminate synthase